LKKKIITFGPSSPPFGGTTVSHEISLDYLQSNNIDFINISTNKKSLINQFAYFFGLLNKYRNYNIFVLFAGSSLRTIYCINLILIFKKKYSFKLGVRFFGADLVELYNNNILHKFFIRRLLKHSNVCYLQTKKVFNYFDKFKSTCWLPTSRKIVSIPTKPASYPIKSFFYLGLISHEKGIIKLLKILKECYNINPNFEFNLAGENTIGDIIYDYPFVNYHGVISNIDDKINFIDSNDVLLFPSEWKSEGYSGTVIEAISRKKIVVVNNHNYLPEMLEVKGNNLGIVFDLNLENNLRDIILNLLNNEIKLNTLLQAIELDYNYYCSVKWNKFMIDKLFQSSNQ
jgi:glycosyltransferase involved in cell wall biosynthesis